MNKENILFAIVGLLLGLIVGFMGANYLNKTGSPVGSNPVGMNSSQLPADHPDIQGQGQGQPTAAMPQVQEAIDAAEKNPKDFDAQIKAAEMFYRIQKFDDAVKYYSRANQAKPDDYKTIVSLGNVNYDAGNYNEAEKWYGKALETKPDDVNVRTDMGLTFIFRQPPDYGRAVQEFKRSLEVDPNHPQTLQNLVVAYTKLNDKANASATLTKLESVDPGNQAIKTLKEEVAKMPN